jgi:hypothetical protein
VYVMRFCSVIKLHLDRVDLLFSHLGGVVRPTHTLESIRVFNSEFTEKIAQMTGINSTAGVCCK